MNIRPFLIAGALSALALSACPKSGKTADELLTEAQSRAEEQVIGSAVAKMEARSGTDVHGTVTFTEIEVKLGERVMDHRVVVAYDLQGLPAGEARGFHIHEHGDCSAPDAMSAGGHFNPHGHDHGGPDADDSHAGDLGNIKANSLGRATGTLSFPPSKFSVAGNDAHNILGKSVIVHVAKDDFVSQPTGDAGPRAACGVIEAK